jgi:hypothetical protein
LTRVPVTGENERTITFGQPTELFPFRYFSQAGGQWWFDLASSDERFLMISRGELATVAPQVIMVQNWAEELKRLVPTN